MIKLTQGRANSAYAVFVQITDERGAPATVLSTTWSLYDKAGRVVGGKEDVSFVGDAFLIPAEDMSGDEKKGEDSRLVLVKAEYISSITGAGAEQQQWAAIDVVSPGRLE